MTKKQSYTIADLLALPDDALNAMAAELRGWTLSNTKVFWRDSGGEVVCHRGGFTPATNRDQSGELLEWAIEHGCQFEISLTAESEIGFRASGGGWSTISIDSGLPRAETVAFCAAMLAMAGRLK